MLLRMIEINPRSVEAYLNAGVMQFEMAKGAQLTEQRAQMLDDAGALLTRAATLAPSSSVAFKNRGIVLGARSLVTPTTRERIMYVTLAIESLERAAQLGDPEAADLAAGARRDLIALESPRR